MSDARQRLRAAQEQVLAALVAGGETPAGFDAERLRVQAVSLVAKRRSVVARLRPDAALAAGPDLPGLFAAYAASRTAPPPGYRADADDFATWLQSEGHLPEPEPDPQATRWWSRLFRRTAS